MITKYVASLFWGERLEWNVSLRPEEVLALVGTKNEGSWMERIFAPGVSARTGHRKFSLAKMGIGNLPMSGNSFVHILAGQVYQTPTGSRVVAQFRLVLPVFIFLSVWLGFLFLIGIVGGTVNLYKAVTTGDINLLIVALIMFMAPIIGTGFLQILRRLGKSNEDEIKKILVTALAEHTI